MKKLLLLIAVSSLVSIISCSKDNGDTMENNDVCDSIDITYDTGIKAIIDGNCALPSCHGGNASLPNFTTYDNIFSLRSLIQSRVVSKAMPPAGSTPLSADNIQNINCWITNGAPK
ncbi:MAG: hypothetical protein KDC53_01835 [Saprospiraceae bacterium]|nr:hypothetical protein [Saprospiraceae bacterium]